MSEVRREGRSGFALWLAHNCWAETPAKLLSYLPQQTTAEEGSASHTATGSEAEAPKGEAESAGEDKEEVRAAQQLQAETLPAVPHVAHARLLRKGSMCFLC